MALDLTRRAQVGLETALVFAKLFKEAGVFEGHCDVRAERLKQLFVAGREGMRFCAFQAKMVSRSCDESFQSMTLKTSKSTRALTFCAMRRRSSSRSRMELNSRLTS